MLLENKYPWEKLFKWATSVLWEMLRSLNWRIFLIQHLLVLNPSCTSQSMCGAFAEAMDNLKNGIIRRQAACWFISFAFKSDTVVFVISVADKHKDQNAEQGAGRARDYRRIYWHRGFAMGASSSWDSRLPSQGICSKTLLTLSPAESWTFR